MSDIIPTSPTGAGWLASVTDLSTVSVEVALNRPMAELVQSALAAAGGESVHTARAYQTAMGLFLQFLGQRERERIRPEWQPLATPTQDGRRTVWEFRGCAAVMRLVDAGLLDDFRAWRAAEGDGKQTQALRRRAVNTFLRVAMRDNVLTQEQAVNLGLKPYQRKERKDEKPVGRRLTPQEVRSLRLIVEMRGRNDRKAARDLALVDCMLYAGLRREEVAGLATGNIRQDTGRWWLVLTGKGQKTRRVKAHDVLYKSLAAWAALTGLVLGEGDTPLFFNMTKGGNSTGKALNPSVLERIVAEYGALAGLAPLHGENRLSPHDLRRTCARNAFDNGASLPQVQALLGHADVKTTMRYIGSMDDDDNTAVDYVRY